MSTVLPAPPYGATGKTTQGTTCLPVILPEGAEAWVAPMYRAFTLDGVELTGDPKEISQWLTEHYGLPKMGGEPFRRRFHESGWLLGRSYVIRSEKRDGEQTWIYAEARTPQEAAAYCLSRRKRSQSGREVMRLMADGFDRSPERALDELGDLHAAPVLRWLHERMPNREADAWTAADMAEALSQAGTGQEDENGVQLVGWRACHVWAGSKSTDHISADRCTDLVTLARRHGLDWVASGRGYWRGTKADVQRWIETNVNRNRRTEWYALPETGGLDIRRNWPRSDEERELARQVLRREHSESYTYWRDNEAAKEPREFALAQARQSVEQLDAAIRAYSPSGVHPVTGAWVFPPERERLTTLRREAQWCVDHGGKHRDSWPTGDDAFAWDWRLYRDSYARMA